jgi:hypothetical protein
MAYTQADLETIQRAIATGSTQLKFRSPDGTERMQTFQSLADLRRIEGEIIRALSGPRHRQTIIIGCKGV